MGGEERRGRVKDWLGEGLCGGEEERGEKGRTISDDADSEIDEKYSAKESTLCWSVRRMLLLESLRVKVGGASERPVFRSLALCRVLTWVHILDEDNLALVPNTYLVQEAFLASSMVFFS